MGEMITALQDGDKRGNGVATNGGNSGPFGLAALRDNPSLCTDNGYIDPERPQFYLPQWQQRNRRNFARGHRWAEAFPIMSGISTILPPNREACGRYNALGTWLIATPSSRHQGGAHILMGDGAVIFMTDSVEAGDSRAPMVWLNGMNVGPPSNFPGSDKPVWTLGRTGYTCQLRNDRRTTQPVDSRDLHAASHLALAQWEAIFIVSSPANPRKNR